MTSEPEPDHASDADKVAFGWRIVERAQSAARQDPALLTCRAKFPSPVDECRTPQKRLQELDFARLRDIKVVRHGTGDEWLVRLYLDAGGIVEHYLTISTDASSINNPDEGTLRTITLTDDVRVD